MNGNSFLTRKLNPVSSLLCVAALLLLLLSCRLFKAMAAVRAGGPNATITYSTSKGLSSVTVKASDEVTKSIWYFVGGIGCFAAAFFLSESVDSDYA